MIQLEHVSFSYTDQGPTVQDVSFHAEKGEFIAILGANGAGKTTTVRLIDGLIRPTAGKVLIHGADTSVSPVSERARLVGFLFQNPDRQICKNTVREEILFGLKTVRGDEGEEALNARCEEILKDFGFSGDEEPFSLSRGQRQRVALASILAVEPEVLILDEPTTGMEVVLDYASRALVMAGGRLLADGPVPEIFRNTELMEEASILPPQMIGLAIRLGKDFGEAATPDEIADTVLALRKGGAQHE